MTYESKEFLKKIIQTPSPSGFEEDIQAVVREYMKPHASLIKTDVHGNVTAVKNPDAPFRVMLAGHCDQIGLLVNYIDAEGFLYVLPLGGWDTQQLVGQRVLLWTESGPIPGVIGKKPIHLLNEEERKKVPKIQDLWIDIGAADKEEAEKLVTVGTPATLELEYRELQNGMFAAPAADDKTGMWVVMEALKRAETSKLNCGVYAVSTVQEEVGLRGSKTSVFGIDPSIGIAVDVTFSTDCPTIEKKQNGEVKLGGGPVLSRGPNMNNKLVNHLIRVAKEHEIPYQICAENRITGTDANPIQVNRSGVATALISIPNRYMHSPVEVVSFKDLDAAANLIARFLESLDTTEDFIPGSISGSL
ncbi:MAG: M42 family metallopeptidase [Planctomycetaceae bacterium]|jgi:endoglucanase|nr:M42 family metallopeptidase [Planctomycetaceae bacterium]